MNNMLSRRLVGPACALMLVLTASPVWAGAKDYQVTGPILAMTDTSITVQKGSEKWEVARDASTKGVEGLKVGDKITIHYTMTASSIESKGGADAQKAPATEKKTKKDAVPAAVPKA